VSGGPARRLARWVGRLIGHVYPESKAGWSRAMQAEIEWLEDDRAALGFALGCLWGGLREAARTRLEAMEGETIMTDSTAGGPHDARKTGLLCALAATGLGLVYLFAAGAPPAYLVVNAAAFLLGAVALSTPVGQAFAGRSRSGAALLMLGLCLLAVALFGASADGATRWIRIGPLGVQLSLVLLPLMIVAYARHSGAVGTLGMAVAAAALALQPDRAMAGVLALAMAALVLARPTLLAAAALAAAAAAFVVTLARPDGLVAVPYVDQVLITAFGVHPLAGAVVLLGALLLLAPAILGWLRDPDQRPLHLAFGATWLGCLLAATLANYPTPVVGYGGSAILGYLLGLAASPARRRTAAIMVDRDGATAEDEDRAPFTRTATA
jgi:hypothetical protein